VTGEDDPGWVCDAWLPGQVDIAGQVRLYDDVCVGWTECWQGRSTCPPGCLLRQRSRPSLPKVWQQRGQETRGRFVSFC